MADVIRAILSWLSGGIVGQIADPLLAAYKAKLAATNDAERLAAESEIARLEAVRSIALAEAQDRLSATRMGRLLIVVPFGLWWAAIFAVSIVNPLFGWSLLIHDLPPRIWDAAMVLVPAIVIADAGAMALRRSRHAHPPYADSVPR